MKANDRLFLSRKDPTVGASASTLFFSTPDVGFSSVESLSSWLLLFFLGLLSSRLDDELTNEAAKGKSKRAITVCSQLVIRPLWRGSQGSGWIQIRYVIHKNGKELSFISTSKSIYYVQNKNSEEIIFVCVGRENLLVSYHMRQIASGGSEKESRAKRKKHWSTARKHSNDMQAGRETRGEHRACWTVRRHCWETVRLRTDDALVFLHVERVLLLIFVVSFFLHHGQVQRLIDEKSVGETTGRRQGNRLFAFGRRGRRWCRRGERLFLTITQPIMTTIERVGRRRARSIALGCRS